MWCRLQSKGQRQSYLDQVASIQASIDETLAKQVAAADAKKKQRDTRADDLQKLIDAQRAYYKGVKEFQEECQVNEALLRKVQQQL